MPVSEQEETQHRTITTPHSTIPTATAVSEADLLEAHVAVALEAVECVVAAAVAGSEDAVNVTIMRYNYL